MRSWHSTSEEWWTYGITCFKIQNKVPSFFGKIFHNLAWLEEIQYRNTDQIFLNIWLLFYFWLSCSHARTHTHIQARTLSPHKTLKSPYSAHSVAPRTICHTLSLSHTHTHKYTFSLLSHIFIWVCSHMHTHLLSLSLCLSPVIVNSIKCLAQANIYMLFFLAASYVICNQRYRSNY